MEATETAPFTDCELFSVNSLRKLSDAVVVLDYRLSSERIELGFDPLQATQNVDFVLHGGTVRVKKLPLEAPATRRRWADKNNLLG